MTSSINRTSASSRSTTTSFSGMASGLDTESMIKAGMSGQKAKIDSMKRKIKLSEWKQDQYREISTSLKDFQSKFMDVLNKSSYMMGSSSYKKFTSTVTSSSTGTASTLVSIKGNGDSQVNSGTISVVQQATAATSKIQNVTSEITSKAVTDMVNLTADKTFTVTVDGIEKAVTIKMADYNGALATVTDADGDGSTDDDKASALATVLKNSIASQVGANKVGITVTTDNKLQFDGTGGSTKLTVAGAYCLGLGGSITNRISTGDTLQTAMDSMVSKLSTDAKGNYALKINGETFSFSKTMTVKEMMKEVNSNEKAGVTMSYNEVSDEFSFKSKTTGFASAVSVDGFKDSNGVAISPTIDTVGQDAKAIVNGQLITRSTNEFIVNGNIYTILREPTAAEAAKINADGNTIDSMGVSQSTELKLDTQAIFDGIKTFVDKYNEMIIAMNTKLNEKYDKDYQPLTDEEKEALKDTEIESLEKKAKTGLLRRDEIVSGITSSMRSALYASIEGVSGGLFSIGITTNKYAKGNNNGTLQYDETELKKAIEADPDNVSEIFNKQSDKNYSRTMSSADRAERYKESGVVQRLYDIIQDSITTSVDKAGNPGKLVAKAGLVGSRFDVDNDIYDQMQSDKKQLDNLWDVYDSKEAALKKKYASLEKMMSQLNKQTSSLTGMLGTN